MSFFSSSSGYDFTDLEENHSLNMTLAKKSLDTLDDPTWQKGHVHNLAWYVYHEMDKMADN